MVMIEVIANDQLGKKVRVKCDSEDTVGDLKVFHCIPSDSLGPTPLERDLLIHCRNLLLHRRVQTIGRLFSRNGIHHTKTISNFPTMKSIMG